MDTKKKTALIIGGALLLWWWLKGRASTSTSTADPMAGVSNLLTSLGGAKATSNPLSDFQGFLGLTNAISDQNKPAPPSDSWVWSGLTGNDRNKIVSLTEFETFDKSKCGSLGCGYYGRQCIRGIDCLPSDPAYKP